MRKGNVYYKNMLAGCVAENEDGYSFTYDAAYLQTTPIQPISLTIPLQQETYQSKILFPFFDGLIPEGWLLQVAIKNWKINDRDRFGLLLTLCNDCIGCISVKAIEE
jgi:serine/threonine-protein kinase HipA